MAVIHTILKTCNHYVLDVIHLKQPKRLEVMVRLYEVRQQIIFDDLLIEYKTNTIIMDYIQHEIILN